MKNKKLLILIVAVSVIAIVAVVFAAVFTVREATLIFHNEQGESISTPADAPTVDGVLKNYRNGNIMFMSKEAFLSDINTRFTSWHAVAVVKSFPDRLDVHFVRRVAVYKLVINGETVYIDSFGYVMALTPVTRTIDVTSAFSGNFSGIVKNAGEKLCFASESDNRRLEYILQSVSSVWRLKYSFDDIPQILSAFSFSTEEYLGEVMKITTKAGAFIKIYKPEKDIEKKLVTAFSVYQNGGKDLQKPGVTITVNEKGEIFTEQN